MIKRYFNGDPSEPLTDRLDRLVLNRFWAFPLLLAVLLSVFFIVFGTPGRYLGELLSTAVNIHLAGLISAALNGMNAPVWLCRLVSQGLLGGVSAVLAFLPQLSLLYLFLTLLEDSGLMARAAFLADGPMRGIGMSGKAFIPMLMGFGCTVPAVFAARTVSSQQEKTATVLLAPFMSCCARMPIYALFAGTFFPLSGGFVSAGIYIWGVAAAVIYGAILRKTVLRGGSAPFLLELAAVPHPGYPHSFSSSVAEMPQLYPAHRNAYRLSFRNNMDTERLYARLCSRLRARREPSCPRRRAYCAAACAVGLWNMAGGRKPFIRHRRQGIRNFLSYGSICRRCAGGAARNYFRLLYPRLLRFLYGVLPALLAVHSRLRRHEKGAGLGSLCRCRRPVPNPYGLCGIVCRIPAAPAVLTDASVRV